MSPGAGWRWLFIAIAVIAAVIGLYIGLYILWIFLHVLFTGGF